MSLTCVKCSRANPADAVYCYHDGFALNGHGGRGAGPVAVGAQQFSNPFVFPSGRSCRSFDELATACQEDWDAARDLLSQGFFGAFFGGMGRADLSRAADEAKKFGDLDRGLDQLLDKLPTQVLQPPMLRVDPQEINLGTFQVGEDRDLQLHLENQSMRLLYGKVMAIDTPWLTLGEGQGVAEKIFQFTHETQVTVHVKGAKLRANNKPLEGKLLVDSNGGDPVTVLVKCVVPVKPYPGSSLLAGARSPRQVAEKAKTNPKESAQLFEKGDVANWYKSNGWTYPVQGPTAVGIGAVQQFFEALGLTPPPKVEISQRSVALTGNAGDQNLQHTLTISTAEKRPVYAHGSSNQPWLEVGRAKLNGRVATITINVPMIPDRPGETLTAKVLIQSNGTQKFVVPVTLQIGQSLDFTGGGDAPAVIPVTTAVSKREGARAIATMPVMTLESTDPEPLPAPVLTPRRRPQGFGMHWMAAAGLALALLLLIILVLTRKAEAIVVPKDKDPPAAGTLVQRLMQTAPKLRVGFTDDNRFGLSLIGVKDPNNPQEEKRLTFGRNGQTNNTVIRINGYEFIFGATRHANTLAARERRQEVVKDKYWTTKIRYVETGVEVTQHVLLVPGASENLENCLVYYSIHNAGNQTPTVSVRVLLDTFIGANDGVPFAIQGRKEFMSTLADLKGKDVPDYIEAVEDPENLKDQGTVARFGLNLSGVKLPRIAIPEIDPRTKEPKVDKKKNPVYRYDYPEVEKFDEITRLVICQQPENPQVTWDWGDKGEFLPIATDLKKDSCVVIYWDATNSKMNPGDTMYKGFTYGLNSLDVKAGAGGTGLTLSADPAVVANKEFTVMAYVHNARPNQPVTLELPDGIELAAGENATQNVPAKDAGKRVPVSWKVKATKLGIKQIKAKSGSTESTPRTIRVSGSSLFG